LGVLIYFIHHVAMSIQAPEVVANVAADLHEAIDRLFPEELGGVSLTDGMMQEACVPAAFEREARPVLSEANGYVQALDGDELLKLSSRHELLIRVERRPGQFVVKRGPLALIWPTEGLDEKVVGRVRDTFLIGAQQTPFQDAEFVVNQLV